MARTDDAPGMFSFFGNDPGGYGTMEMRRRIALQMMGGNKKGYPKNIGEGLASIGDSLGEIGMMRAMLAAQAKQDAASKATAEKIYGPGTTGIPSTTTPPVRTSSVNPVATETETPPVETPPPVDTAAIPAQSVGLDPEHFTPQAEPIVAAPPTEAAAIGSEASSRLPATFAERFDAVNPPPQPVQSDSPVPLVTAKEQPASVLAPKSMAGELAGGVEIGPEHAPAFAKTSRIPIVPDVSSTTSPRAEASLGMRTAGEGNPWVARSNAIAGIESGGAKDPYSLVGAATKSGDRAMGKYQIMASNVPEWTEAALGKRMTPQEFLADPHAQEATFKNRFGQYVDKYGEEGAAKAWFGGESGMKNPNATDVHGRLTVASYGRDYLRRLGETGEQTASASPRDQIATRLASADGAIPQTAGGVEPQFAQGKDFKRVNPTFMQAATEYAKTYGGESGMGVRFTSGYREGDPRQHGKGNAFDIELVDSTGKALGNYHDNPQNFPQYQKFANGFHQYLQANYPELAAQHRWGGYFSGGRDKYGSLDLMHHDLAGHIGMAGGSWDKGLSPRQASIYGLQPGGGAGGETQVASASPRENITARLVANTASPQPAAPVQPDAQDAVLADVLAVREAKDAAYPQTASLGGEAGAQSDAPQVGGMMGAATGDAIAATAAARRNGIAQKLMQPPPVAPTPQTTAPGLEPLQADPRLAEANLLSPVATDVPKSVPTQRFRTANDSIAPAPAGPPQVITPQAAPTQAPPQVEQLPPELRQGPPPPIPAPEPMSPREVNARRAMAGEGSQDLVVRGAAELVLKEETDRRNRIDGMRGAQYQEERKHYDEIAKERLKWGLEREKRDFERQKHPLEIKKAEQETEDKPIKGDDGRFYLWDRTTKTMREVTPPPPGTAEGGPPRPKMTEGQQKAQEYHDWIATANEQMHGKDKLLAEGLQQELLGKVPFVGNKLQQAEYRQVKAASERFIQGFLRSISGAAIGEKEIQTHIATFMPKYGDDDKTIADKRQAREGLIGSLYAGAGPGAAISDYYKAERDKKALAEHAKLDKEMADTPKIVGKVYKDTETGKRRAWTGDHWEEF